MRIRKIVIKICLINLMIVQTLLCERKAISIVSVADLRGDPTIAPVGLSVPAMSKDIGNQLSQVLFGEKLLLDSDENTDDWVHVSALEQEINQDDKAWIGCPGYVKNDQIIEVEEFPVNNIVLQDLWTDIYQDKDVKSRHVISLACGTMLEAMQVNEEWYQVYFLGKPFGFLKTSNAVYELTLEVKETETQLREKLVNIAKCFVKCPYVWGGRSPLNKELMKNDAQITGMDCSDFTNVVFKSLGLQIPKNSRSQYLGAPKKIKYGKDLKPGDLLFFKRSSDLKVVHVMFYLGNDEIIESTGLGVSSVQEAIDKNLDPRNLGVRIIKLKEYIGVSSDKIESDKTVYEKRGYVVCMGSYLNSKEDIQILRAKLLSL